MAPKSARRGVKRKAEVLIEEEKSSVEEKKERGGEEESGQQGQRVIIEHWNSFEITLVDGGKETPLWTGIKKGPPRKLKFPQPDVVVTALQEALKAE
ncbi:hypothetical protein L3Q82_020555 [Scortum barcoo]|uniref:Uncharacterized protein n=1 Tax=Scortum barcoo TaxID=214431 RepID=A0ACB8V8P9_9TELE|nr:hypothetical protein L3Q82_020555 [Scortum barcoo]